MNEVGGILFQAEQRQRRHLISERGSSSCYVCLSMKHSIKSHGVVSYDLCRSHDRNGEGQLQSNFHRSASSYKPLKRNRDFNFSSIRMLVFVGSKNAII